MAQYPVSEVKPCSDPVTHEPITSIPEEIKPIVDVVLSVIKHQSASSSKTPVQNSADLNRGTISREKTSKAENATPLTCILSETRVQQMLKWSPQ